MDSPDESRVDATRESTPASPAGAAPEGRPDPPEGSGRGVRGDGPVPPEDESGAAGTGAPGDHGVRR
jgi:hypothetical protein